MSPSRLAGTLSLLLSTSLVYLGLVLIMMGFIHNYRVTAKRLNVVAWWRARQKYLLTPLRHDAHLRHLFVTKQFVAVIALISTLMQFSVTTDGIPFATALLICTSYGLLWFLSATADQIRHYWHAQAQPPVEFVLTGNRDFRFRKFLFKSALVAATVVCLSYLVYLLNFVLI